MPMMLEMSYATRAVNRLFCHDCNLNPTNKLLFTHCQMDSADVLAVKTALMRINQQATDAYVRCMDSTGE